MKVNKLLVAIVCAGIASAIVCGVVGIVVVWRAMGWGPHEPPEELAKPGVKIGAGFLTKRVFFEDKDLGSVDDIAYGDLDPKPGLEVGITDGRRALFLNQEGRVKSVVTFPKDHYGLIEMIEVDGDDACEFIPRKFAAPRLMDHRGQCIWHHEEDGADVMCAGDMNGDGVPEFAVGFAGSGGVHLLDRNGKLVWRQPDGNVWRIAMTDTNGDGKLEIVHCNSRGELVVRDATGEVLSRIQPYIPGADLFFPYYVGDFSLCRWPRSAARASVVLAANGVNALVDYDGKVKSRFEIPRLGDDMDVQAVTVELNKNRPEYLAVVGFMAPWGKSTLFIFDREKKLIYHETLPGRCEALAAMPRGKTGEEALLVGGEGKVWEYTAAVSGGRGHAQPITTSSH